jgi:undecaprenyl-diphosphatase
MIRYLWVGLVQGVTEFLPVSSSGHLVLAQRLIGLNPPGVLLEAMLHLGTLGAILIVFWKDLWKLLSAVRGRGTVEQRKDVGLLLMGSVPVVVAGLLLRRVVEGAFASLWTVGLGLLGTAVALSLGHRARRRAVRSQVRVRDALTVGMAQAVALFPGVSRSGITLSAGMTGGLSSHASARFSFLLAVPALAGAGALQLAEALRGTETVHWPGVALGTATAFVSGWLALRALLYLLRRGRFWVFAVYCAVVGLTSILVAWWG